MARQHFPAAAVAMIFLAAIASLVPCRSVAVRRGAAAAGTGLVVQGRVFCDTCRAGFETPATTYLSGAKVRVECRDRNTGAWTCSFDGTTDETGTYNIPVASERWQDEICESVLVSSPQKGCGAAVVPGRERSRVSLVRDNGIVSNTRFANSMGFLRDAPLPDCARVMQAYARDENDV